MKTERLKETIAEIEKRFKNLLEDDNISRKEMETIGNILFDLDIDNNFIEQGKFVRIHYDNRIAGISSLVPENGKGYVFAIMLFYTIVNYKIKRAYKIFSEERILQIKQIEEILRREIIYVAKNDVILSEKELKSFRQKVRAFQKKARKLERNELKQLYLSLSIGNKYITYEDFLGEEKTTLKINDSRFVYAVMNLFSEVYCRTILYLKEIDSTGQWCFREEWQILTELRELTLEMFFY
jgi:hypothetical protein